VFKDSVRGLTPGAPVEFRGIPIGDVTAIRAQIDLKTFDFSVPVSIQLDPERLGVRLVELKPGTDLETVRRSLIDSMVAHGVRAQLRTGNLLTGSAYVALDFFPNAAPVHVDWSQQPVQLPTTAGQFAATQATVEDLLKKLDSMPLQEIGENLRKTIADLDLTIISARGTLASAQGTLDNTSSLTGPNSAQVQQLDQTLQEVSRAARSLRVLADYLEAHPESLVRGKRGEAK
jgi:paraquat-inducible protein B